MRLSSIGLPHAAQNAPGDAEGLGREQGASATPAAAYGAITGLSRTYLEGVPVSWMGASVPDLNGGKV